jgi:hypothetical protein
VTALARTLSVLAAPTLTAGPRRAPAMVVSNASIADAREAPTSEMASFNFLKVPTTFQDTSNTAVLLGPRSRDHYPMAIDPSNGTQTSATT